MTNRLALAPPSPWLRLLRSFLAPQASLARAALGTSDFRGPLTGLMFAELIVMQLIVWVFFGLFLDFGVLARACGISLLGYWAGVAWIFRRRAGRLTLGDRLFVEVGWLALLVLGMWAALWYWRAIGAFG